MNRSFLRPVPSADSDAILNILTTRQHLSPHEPLEEALRSVIDGLGCCPAAVQNATQWLKVDPAQAIGRLRRTELMQLAKAVHRFWSRSLAEAAQSAASPR
jgi:hypothetical protein